MSEQSKAEPAAASTETTQETAPVAAPESAETNAAPVAMETAEQAPEAPIDPPAQNTEAKTQKRAVTKKPTPPEKKAVAKPAPAAKTKSSHPPFFEMITQAIKKLNDRTGSSRQAILKFIVANFKVEEKSGNQHVKVVLKNAVKAGTLKQVKGVGASGSFKLSEALKTKEKTKDKNETKAAKRTAATNLPAAAKKSSTKSLPKKITVTVTKVKNQSNKKTAKPHKNVKKLAAKPVAQKTTVVKKTQPAKKVTKQAAKAQTKTSPTIGRRGRSVVGKAVANPKAKKTARK